MVWGGRVENGIDHGGIEEAPPASAPTMPHVHRHPVSSPSVFWVSCLPVLAVPLPCRVLPHLHLEQPTSHLSSMATQRPFRMPAP